MQIYVQIYFKKMLKFITSSKLIVYAIVECLVCLFIYPSQLVLH